MTLTLELESPTQRDVALLVQRLENEVARRGHRRVRLETGMYNAEAMALYESSGYALIPQFDNYVGTPISVCYEKRLEPVAA